MKYLYLWRFNTYPSKDLCLSKPMTFHRPAWTYMGPYETTEDAKNAWVLLGRKTVLIYVKTYNGWLYDEEVKL